MKKYMYYYNCFSRSLERTEVTKETDRSIWIDGHLFRKKSMYADGSYRREKNHNLIKYYSETEELKAEYGLTLIRRAYPKKTESVKDEKLMVLIMNLIDLFNEKKELNK